MFSALAASPADIQTDVCVIGGGAAGITVARALSGASLDVVLCEAGGLDYSEQSQGHYQGTVVGRRYYPLQDSRLRFFGGSTNHWGGWCRPLDPYDFSAKSGNRLLEWPIGAQDLQPYAAEASSILEASPPGYEQPLGDSRLKRIAFAYSPPVRLGEKFRAEFDRRRNIRVLLHANLVAASSAGSRLKTILLRDYQGNERVVSARHFVLACGGIENSRLLLWLHHTGGLPATAATGLVGRYWMEHPLAPVGVVIITEKTAFSFDKMALDFFAPTRAFMEDRGTLNCQLYLKSTAYGGAKEVVADLMCVAPDFGRWVMDQLGKKLACVAELKATWEQGHNPENRITLSHEKDSFGLPRPVLNWSLGDQDMHTVRETTLAFASHCAEADIARVRLPEWLTHGSTIPEFPDMAGHHHMGGTRMAASPEAGVVDSNCRMFGTGNLYLAGSSVFPSGGHTSPTFTIVQLSLRLADHLRRTIAAGS